MSAVGALGRTSAGLLWFEVYGQLGAMAAAVDNVPLFVKPIIPDMPKTRQRVGLRLAYVRPLSGLAWLSGGETWNAAYWMGVIMLRFRSLPAEIVYVAVLCEWYQSTIDVPSGGVVLSAACAACRRRSVGADGGQRADAGCLANAWLSLGFWQGHKVAETGSLLRRANLRAENEIMKSAGLPTVFSWLAIVAVVATMAPPALSSSEYDPPDEIDAGGDDVSSYLATVLGGGAGPVDGQQQFRLSAGSAGGAGWLRAVAKPGLQQRGRQLDHPAPWRGLPGAGGTGGLRIVAGCA